MSSKPNVLCTGVTGQDGSYLSELLCKKGYNVTGMVRRASTNNLKNLDDVISLPNFKLVEGDLSDRYSIYDIVDKARPDYIYNLGAMSHVATSFNQPDYTFAVDAMGPMYILDAVRKFVPECRVYQASTSEQFGSQYSTRMGPDGKPEYFQNEETLMIPNSPYAIAKMAAFHSVKMHREAYGTWACSGILFNHDGPRRGENFVTRKVTKYCAELITKYSRTIHEMPAEIVNPDKVPKLRLGNLDAYRDWSDARDMVRGMIMMLEQDAPRDLVLASGTTRTIRELLSASFAQLNAKFLNNQKYKWEDFVEVDQSNFRPLEVPYLRGCPLKARFHLGWKPEISFDQMINDMLDSDIRNGS